MVGEDSFVEVFVDAPADVVAKRKAERPKKPALRKRVRRSLKAVAARFGLEGEGGYERPLHPDVHVQTTRMSPVEGAELVMAALAKGGKISWDPAGQRSQS
jgi:adenylylsulfate kinase-like enzyme